VALDGYKVVLNRNQPDGWVAEVPAISGCYALMPTREEALRELEQVFEMIAGENRDRGVPLPADTTEIVHAWRGKIPPGRAALGIPARTREEFRQG
jgi:predicted RNase H-like HicB family nuclease